MQHIRTSQKEILHPVKVPGEDGQTETINLAVVKKTRRRKPTISSPLTELPLEQQVMPDDDPNAFPTKFGMSAIRWREKNLRAQ